MVALTGRNEAYYSDYLGNPQEFVSAASTVIFIRASGTAGRSNAAARLLSTYRPRHSSTSSRITIRWLTRRAANVPTCSRRRGKYRAMTALLMLMPGTPMLFQGQEFGATTPFLFFCDHKAEISKQVREGRAKFLAQFRSLSLPEMQSVFRRSREPPYLRNVEARFFRAGEERGHVSAS